MPDAPSRLVPRSIHCQLRHSPCTMHVPTCPNPWAPPPQPALPLLEPPALDSSEGLCKALPCTAAHRTALHRRPARLDRRTRPTYIVQNIARADSRRCVTVATDCCAGKTPLCMVGYARLVMSPPATSPKQYNSPKIALAEPRRCDIGVPAGLLPACRPARRRVNDNSPRI
jgi:hypothetical protein